MSVTNAETASENAVVRKSKSSMSAPCAYEAWDEVRHKNVQVFPAVNCGYHCDTCGWNPEIAKKRVEKMQAELAARKKVKKC